MDIRTGLWRRVEACQTPKRGKRTRRRKRGVQVQVVDHQEMPLKTAGWPLYGLLVPTIQSRRDGVKAGRGPGGSVCTRVSIR